MERRRRVVLAGQGSVVALGGPLIIHYGGQCFL
jgi:hypothetical protein